MKRQKSVCGFMSTFQYVKTQENYVKTGSFEIHICTEYI
jgi:hypothetical protein